MNDNSAHLTLRQRIDRLEGILTDGGLVSTMQTTAILLELVAELAGRLAAVDGGQTIDQMYVAALARRAAASAPVPARGREGGH